MTVILRPYQLEGERRIRQAFKDGCRAPLFVMSTGSGKTFLFASIAHSAERRARRVLIICHRVELVEQIVEALKAFDVNPDIIAASYHRGGPFQNKSVAVASVQTLIRRLKDYAPPTLIIIDEAHHAVAGSWSEVLKAYPQAKILGVTATPCRLDGRGLGAHFDTLILGPSEQELIAGGYLVPTRIFAPKLVDTSGLHIRMGDVIIGEAEALMDKPAITGSAFSHYMQHTPNEQGLIFCTSVQHAENVAKQFRDGGIPALSLNGGTDKTVRRMVITDFREGKIRLLSSCDLFSEGLDIVGARVGIMLRPIQSLTLYRQQRGRIMRPAPDKQYATLIDCVRNCEKPGFELLPGEVDDWQLTEDMAHKKRKPPPGIRVCPKCFAASNPRAQTCSNCGEKFEVQSRELDERDGELEEITPEEIARRRAKRAAGFEQSRADSVEKLVALWRKRGYTGNLEGRARHVLAARAAKKQRSLA